MSYDISSWKTKEIDNLLVPILSLHYSNEYRKRGWTLVKTTELLDGKIIFTCSFGTASDRVQGILNPDTGMIEVTKLELCGEGSGMNYLKIILPALEKSSGRFSAILIWEGGDSVTRLEVNDGIVSDEPWELF